MDFLDRKGLFDVLWYLQIFGSESTPDRIRRRFELEKGRDLW